MATEEEIGEALQLIELNMQEKKVEVNEKALSRLEKNLRDIGAQKVAVVSVMGAFRTGKSFLLDLFLRFLRYERKAGIGAESESRSAAPPRGGGEPFPVPAWMIDAGAKIEGGDSEKFEGFRFKGGMDHCTEGIWVWSRPFLRQVDGETVAMLLMDTQGAWDGNMSKEQSATVFGLTALLSSKQIYNINMQIQEDKVENLAYFMRFAQAALRKAAQAMSIDNISDLEKPFQTLDFLVRDWANFEDSWTMEECREQMTKHGEKHTNPANLVENSTAEALQSMFTRIGCFCMPHPGLKIQKAAWTGAVSDIDQDFIRFVDAYVYEVFSEGLKVKQILGSELSTMTFPLILRNFVKAFQDAAPAAMSFTQAMTSATVLLAKEQAMKSYTKKMDEAASKHPRGIAMEEFAAIHTTLSKDIALSYANVTILGSDETRDDAWNSIKENLQVLYQQYREDNARRLERALVAFGNVTLLALLLFVLDRASDWTCDWWSQTCRDLSKLMLTVYVAIVIYVGYFVYILFRERGSFATAAAGTELWKEMIRLISVYWEYAHHLQPHDLKALGPKVIDTGKAWYETALHSFEALTSGGGRQVESKKQK